MAKDKSETKHVSSDPQPLANLLGAGTSGHYETTITFSDGSSVKGAGRTSGQSQKAASDMADKRK